jgi:putative transposase
MLYTDSMDETSYKSNRNVCYACHSHVVWCPKYRRKVLVPPLDERLKQLIGEVCEEHDAEMEALEVLLDHVHLLINVNPQFGIHRLMKLVKRRSSRLLRQEFPVLKRKLPTLWTTSYFCATIGGAPLAVVKQYIERQKHV